MLRRTLASLARKKNGQTAWSPNTGGGFNKPTTTGQLSANEGMAMMYRPMPSRDTVDYEEDFYNSLMLQRECIPRRVRANLAGFHDVPLVFSDTELREGKRQIAKVQSMANTRSVGAEDRDDYTAERSILNIEKSATFDPATETLTSVRYLFTEDRLQYCQRFVRGLRRLYEEEGGQGEDVKRTERDRKRQQNGGSSSSVDMDDPHEALKQTPLHGLMEVSAILFGAVKEEAEDYLSQFGLAKDQLDAACEAQRAVTETALGTIEAYNAATQMAAMHDNAQQQIEGGRGGEGDDGSAAMPSVPITADNVDFATTYAAYIDFASGKTATPIPSPTLGLGGGSTVASSPTSHQTSPASSSVGLSVADRHLLSNKLRWRALVDTLVAEDYHHLDGDDMKDMAAFSNYLHTFKFMEYKVGDCVRQIVGAKHRDFGASDTHNTSGVGLAAVSRPTNPMTSRGADRTAR